MLELIVEIAMVGAMMLAIYEIQRLNDSVDDQEDQLEKVEKILIEKTAAMEDVSDDLRAIRNYIAMGEAKNDLLIKRIDNLDRKIVDIVSRYVNYGTPKE